ncbi:MAG: UDP-3-O-(3-hydroxymyristoyl)glucosamine N-acyltransferase [Gammaproteobacteria bacterium]|nr:UDP-3-O-(3-hydroxymyristoyl)glucosamine N-acyltransferase [Gammaproteobacteria bacterium]
MTWALKQIADHVAGSVKGNSEFEIDSVGTLQHANSNQITFLANAKYKKYLATTQAGAVIVEHQFAYLVSNNAIIVSDPYVAYAKIATLMYPQKSSNSGIDVTASVHKDSVIHPTASIAAHVVIEEQVTIGESVSIGPGCIIKRGCILEEGTYLVANVTLCDSVKIGKHCIIHPGVVIGADGFGIANDKGKWIKIPQIGRVIIGNDVEIGANTTIDRGAIEDTVIGNGVKLDNQIQIGHNTIIGDNTVIAGCVGIAGSTTIGKNCAIGGGAGLGGHLEIVDGVQLTGMTMVTKSILTPGVYSSGIPAEPTQQWHKNVVRYRHLEQLNDRVKKLENTQ